MILTDPTIVDCCRCVIVLGGSVSISSTLAKVLKFIPDNATEEEHSYRGTSTSETPVGGTPTQFGGTPTQFGGTPTQFGGTPTPVAPPLESKGINCNGIVNNNVDSRRRVFFPSSMPLSHKPPLYQLNGRDPSLHYNDTSWRSAPYYQVSNIICPGCHGFLSPPPAIYLTGEQNGPCCCRCHEHAKIYELGKMLHSSCSSTILQFNSSFIRRYKGETVGSSSSLSSDEEGQKVEFRKCECQQQLNASIPSLTKLPSSLFFPDGSAKLVMKDCFVLKIIHKEKCTAAERRRCRKEAEFLCKARHPNVVSLLLGWESQSHLCLALEWADVGDLQLAARYKQSVMNEESVKYICRELLSTLNYLHGVVKVVHGDMKPENVLLFSKTQWNSSFQWKDSQRKKESRGALRNNNSNNRFIPAGNFFHSSKVRELNRLFSVKETATDECSETNLCLATSWPATSWQATSWPATSWQAEPSIIQHNNNIPVQTRGLLTDSISSTEGGFLSSSSSSSSYDQVSSFCSVDDVEFLKGGQGGGGGGGGGGRIGPRRRKSMGDVDAVEKLAKLEEHEEAAGGFFCSHLFKRSGVFDKNNTTKNCLRIKLADFGLAQHNPLNLIPFDGVRGSHGFFAPEMLLHQDYGEKIDIWAVGIMAFTLLVGYEPFYPSSRCICDPLVFDERYWTDISKEAINFIEQTLEKDPSIRLTAEQALRHNWVL